MTQTPAPAASETAALKGVQKLQRAIIDGLEDVKAQDIVVFNTAHLTSLFERVIVASGSSNRQTKALAASVRDAVKEAGFQKPRIEGEDNGEWIVVDCGAAVAHIMQPTIRAYYHLEEIWGEKPVRVKFGAAKPAAAAQKPPAKSDASKARGDANYAGRSPGAAKTAQRAAEQLAKAQALAAKAPRKRAKGGVAAKKTVAKKAPTGQAAPVRASAKTAAAPKKAVAAKVPAAKAAKAAKVAKKPAKTA